MTMIVTEAQAWLLDDLEQEMKTGRTNSFPAKYIKDLECAGLSKHDVLQALIDGYGISYPPTPIVSKTAGEELRAISKALDSEASSVDTPVCESLELLADEGIGFHEAMSMARNGYKVQETRMYVAAPRSWWADGNKPRVITHDSTGINVVGAEFVRDFRSEEALFTDEDIEKYGVDEFSTWTTLEALEEAYND